MKYHEMTKNYIFREFECHLSVKEAAELCFKSVRNVTEWDKGKLIPNECKRLMRMHRRLELSSNKEWQGFKMENSKLRIPTGDLVSPQQILTGLALIEINSELEIKTSTQLLKLSRAISTVKTK
ncbi:bacteriophage f237 ORF9 [Vibrio ichthyoenteri ATCC 700023]|uniref:Bacteriophage f237 ORF9 n=1 Tax=Vibrio ichthyoenteri ATCC 700023 TaxID=870968 RepID=F9S7V3_9VIBR|nr:phage protein [Vibrio ichthyoenteri]EGU31003.1 bacteriophage f237 ORF9 [Vibrio ichthyoenteri ATCC 700023]